MLYWSNIGNGCSGSIVSSPSGKTALLSCSIKYILPWRTTQSPCDRASKLTRGPSGRTNHILSTLCRIGMVNSPCQGLSKRYNYPSMPTSTRLFQFQSTPSNPWRAQTTFANSGSSPRVSPKTRTSIVTNATVSRRWKCYILRTRALEL